MNFSSSEKGVDRQAGAAIPGCLPRRQAVVELGLFFLGFWLLLAFAPGLPLLEFRPHPFWIPVLLLSLQYGTVEGLLAALAGTVAIYLLGWPTQSLGEDYFDFWLRAWLELSLWITTALIIGALRQSQIVEKTQLEGDLDRAHRKATALADTTLGLRRKIDQLERRISAGGLVSHAAFQNVAAFYECAPSNFEEKLREVIPALIGDVDWSLTIKRQGNRLTFAGGPTAHFAASLKESDRQTILAAFSRERRVLALHRPEDAFLRDLGVVFASPIENPNSHAIDGVLVVSRQGGDSGGGEIEESLVLLSQTIASVLDRLWPALSRSVKPARTGKASGASLTVVP